MTYANAFLYTLPGENPLSRGAHRAAASTSKACATIRTWRSRSRQRRGPVRFGDHQLRDIGVRRADAWAEASKPFWKA